MARSSPAVREASARQAVRRALDEAGPQVVADATRLCSGAYPPPSKGGDFPHSRSGAVAGGFSYRIEDGPTGPIFVLSNNAPHAGFLQNGTSRMAARPFFTLVMAKWGPLLTQRTADAIASSGTSGGAVGRVRGFVGRVGSAVSSGFRSLFGY